MKVKPSNAASAPKRNALGDASNRANQSPSKVTKKKPSTGKEREKDISFEEYMAAARQQFEEAQSFGPRPTIASGNTKRPKAKSAAASGGASSSSNKKGKAETTLEQEIAVYTQNLDDLICTSAFEDDPLPSCQTVRNHIHKLLDAGIMTKTDFSKAIGCRSVNTLNAFLRQTGSNGGSSSVVYFNAWAWFRQREVAKLKMPDMKKKQAQEAGAASGSSAGGSTSKTAAAKSLPDISHIYLGGEDEDDVSVWDTCDEVRKKINAHLRTSGVTQAQFCRDIFAQLRQPKIKSIQSKQLSDFLHGKGPRTGAKSTVFYAAWVYFEKLRIASGKPKSKHREDMEDIWSCMGGFDRTADNRTSFVVRAESNPRMDRYGRIFG
ncbi:uncharacterized protein GGS22DRAFT_189171 [Annulohypoxylon maeteangense]|uniref:uncharacterized protein n=1 Tax=Annulohypoxylon maeteangense TaxID=1927788 RepID=UPI002008A962|nr:uncharacterized protein GGS22DRAFT_189171 [Annulohypoxylon maeteangense]KAI0884045.1 hypothetical protein GGS22DRAFT_189171 [Annulohypoxylon maeteangense]